MLRSLLRTSVVMGAVVSASVALAAPAQAESEVVLSGTFEGRSDHVTSGGISVLETDAGTLVVLDADFFLDGAPDPKLGFGKDGYVASTQFTVLESNTGAQIYVVPDNIEPADFNEFWVWCEKFNVPLGVATLN